MSTSDLLVLFSLVLVVIALINPEERKFVWNKFSSIDYIFLVLIFSLINVLSFHDWWRKSLSFLQVLEFKGFPEASTWAYILSLIILFWVAYKIFYAPFPKENRKKILEFYLFLLNREKYHELYNYIEKYHYKELINNKKELGLDLVNYIVSDKLFLKNTAHYNYSLVKNLINQSDSSSLKINYVESQLITTSSFTLNNLDSIDNDLYEILSVDRTIFDRSLKYNLRNELTDVFRLYQLVFGHYVFLSHKKELEDLRNLEILAVKIRKDKKDYLLELFKDLFSGLLYFETRLRNFRLFYRFIVAQLNVSIIHIDKKLHSTLFSEFIKVSIKYFDVAETQKVIISELTVGVKDESYIDFRNKLYYSYKDINLNNCAFEKSIISTISNY